MSTDKPKELWIVETKSSYFVYEDEATANKECASQKDAYGYAEVHKVTLSSPTESKSMRVYGCAGPTGIGPKTPWIGERGENKDSIHGVDWTTHTALLVNIEPISSTIESTRNDQAQCIVYAVNTYHRIARFTETKDDNSF